MATGEVAPYKTLVTHGFVLDPNKQKMSKSLGNVVDPSLVIHGGKCVWPLPLPYVIVAGGR